MKQLKLSPCSATFDLLCGLCDITVIVLPSPDLRPKSEEILEYGRRSSGFLDKKAASFIY
jgi:hypothetical protein